MTKIFKFLFVFSFLALASQAEAKVCFLPGVFADDGCLDGTFSGSDDSCAGYDRTSECPAGYKQKTCTTKNGTKKYRCICDEDNVFTPAQMQEYGYKCTMSYDAKCGCPRQDTICDKTIFPLAQGDGYCESKLPNTKPNKVCTNPSDNDLYKVKGKKDFYDMCICSNYPYNCNSTGLTPPSNTYLSCTDSNGKKHYSACDCASNWSETPCNQRTDGCTEVSNKVDKLGTSDKCYLCSSYKCPNAGDINLEEYWCDVPQGLETDCEKLGYTNTNGGACPDGKVTVKCPFNRKYMYCPSGSCNPGFAHTVDECSTNKDATGGYTLGALDSDGCGQCIAKTCPIVQLNINEDSSAGSSLREVQSTTDNDVEHCGNTGKKGYSISITGAYSGEKACYVCKPNSCPDGFTADISNLADCPNPSLMKYEAAQTSSGDKICGKCTYVQGNCPSGYVQNLTNVTQCGPSGDNGWDLKTQGTCGQCTAKACQQGSVKNSEERITVTTRNNISFSISLSSYNDDFFTFEPNGFYSGNSQCGKHTFNINNFCDGYRREVAYCASKIKEEYGKDDEAFFDCLNDVDENWDAHYDNVNRCSLCMGIFGSTGDRYFCRDLWYW